MAVSAFSKVGDIDDDDEAWIVTGNEQEPLRMSRKNPPRIDAYMVIDNGQTHTMFKVVTRRGSRVMLLIVSSQEELVEDKFNRWI